LTLGKSLFLTSETVKTTLNDRKNFKRKLSAIYSFYTGYFVFVQAELTGEIKEGVAVKSQIKIN
jgi:hypothetical protein